jgi:chromosomal replication initiator protein
MQFSASTRPDDDEPFDSEPLPAPPANSGPPPQDHAASDLGAQWMRLQGELQTLVKREQFETWFRRAALQSIAADRVAIAVQNGFARDWLWSNYREQIELAVHAVFGAGRRFDLVVNPELTAAPLQRPSAPSGAAPSEDEPSPPPAPARAHARGSARPAPAEPAKQLLWASDVVLNPQYRFDNFVVGPCNRFAHAAALGVSEMPGEHYNPFFLHGNVGLGKTHLLQSMCFAMLERVPDTRILYLSCETFINHFIGALENGDLQKFRGKYRNVDILVVDDIHLLANKDRTQEEFFHTFNTLYNAGKQIVLSSDSPPKEIPTLQERLVSRFKWGLVSEIEPPCYETRMAIIRRKSKQRGKELSEDVAQLLAENVANNVRELEGAVTRVIGFATLSGQEVTPELVRKVLSELFEHTGRGQPTMDDILKVVTSHFAVKTTDLQSRRRTNAIAHPRQVGMYLARRITRHSLEEIGVFFGGRDHSTVLYAIQKIEKQQREDEAVRNVIARLLDVLQQGQ